MISFLKDKLKGAIKKFTKNVDELPDDVSEKIAVETRSVEEVIEGSPEKVVEPSEIIEVTPKEKKKSIKKNIAGKKEFSVEKVSEIEIPEETVEAAEEKTIEGSVSIEKKSVDADEMSGVHEVTHVELPAESNGFFSKLKKVFVKEELVREEVHTIDPAVEKERAVAEVEGLVESTESNELIWGIEESKEVSEETFSKLSSVKAPQGVAPEKTSVFKKITQVVTTKKISDS